MFSLISVSPQVYHGNACVAGTRIPVFQVVRMLAHGETIDSLLHEYPSLTREAILECLDYASFAVEAQRPAAVEAAAREYEIADLTK